MIAPAEPGQEVNRADEDLPGRFPVGPRMCWPTAQRRSPRLPHRRDAKPNTFGPYRIWAASMHELLKLTAAANPVNRVRSPCQIDKDACEPNARPVSTSTIDQDSRRLAESAQALVGTLRPTPEIPPPHLSAEEVEAFLARAPLNRLQRWEVRWGCRGHRDLNPGRPDLQSGCWHGNMRACFTADFNRCRGAADCRADPTHSSPRADPSHCRAARRPWRVFCAVATVPNWAQDWSFATGSGTFEFFRNIHRRVLSVPLALAACCPLWLLHVLGKRPAWCGRNNGWRSWGGDNRRLICYVDSEP